MAIANSYPTVTPKITDLLIGTQTPDIDNDDDQATTKNFSVGDIINLVKFEPIPGTGTVTSINGSIDGDALSLSNLPITTAGTIGFNWQGDNLQYINGFGDLETFPTIPTAITLTTNGTAGASTLTNGVLNVPNYAAPVDPGVTSIVAGTNVTISPVGGTGAVTINAAGGGGGSGTVTRVGALDGTFISSTSADITTAGDLTYDLSATGTPSATNFLRGDNSWATPTTSLPYTFYTALLNIQVGATATSYTITELSNTTGKTVSFVQGQGVGFTEIQTDTAWADIDKVMYFLNGPAAHGLNNLAGTPPTLYFEHGNNCANLSIEIRVYP
jgi:hypothetical protein|tara:strand:- start:3523 stop:4509 length:987 start_codon:yes stop_codon:yes gene_type:complete